MIFNCIADMRGRIHENNIKVYPVWKISPLHFKNVGDRKTELIRERGRRKAKKFCIARKGTLLLSIWSMRFSLGPSDLSSEQLWNAKIGD